MVLDTAEINIFECFVFASVMNKTADRRRAGTRKNWNLWKTKSALVLIEVKVDKRMTQLSLSVLQGCFVTM